MSKAVGIPSRENYGNISDIPVNQLLTYIDQLHKARRAGKHHDIRFGDKELFSWATRKGLPEPGQKRMLFQQPIHSKEYADFEGEIPEGYGAGVVSKSDKGTVLVTEATPNKVKFVLAHKKYPEYYTMIRQEGANKPWLMINHTPTSPEQVLGNKDLFSKVHIKSVPADKAEEFLNGVVEGKVDGASGLFKLKKDSIDVLSYRIGTNGRPIVHTERFFGGKAPTVDIPKKWQNKVLRGEIYGVDKNDQPLSSQEVTPLLNMSLAKSIQNQQDTKTKLRGALFGVAGEDLNTPTRESELKEVLSFLPPQYFDRPPVAHGPEEGMKLWKEIEKGKHPEISEGVVVYPESGDAPLKIKLRPEYDVQVSGVFPGEGKYTGSAGGIEYKVPDGVGRVGTGFDDDFRKWLWENKDSLEGRIARITSTKKLPSGKYFQPSFMGLHEDYPTKKAEDDISVSFLPDYTPDQLKEMGVYKEVYGPADAPRLASLPQWPTHWYNEADPHGWLQWYDRYSKGRRIEDDKRQIKRWLAFKARHGGKAFKSNPTPRRAYALRNWGIDPTKLVDDPESLKAVMDEYKQKQYSKKMEKVSFLPKETRKIASNGNNSQANSFLPKTGAIMTPISRRSADEFYNLADNVNQKNYDPVKGLNTYIQDGSNLMSEKIMGQRMSPVDIVKLVRKSGLASAITGDFDLMKWDPKSQAHYDAFSSGPVSAYSQFIKEKNTDDPTWRDTSEKLTVSLKDRLAPGFEVSRATGRAPWGYATRVRDAASRGADVYEPVGRQTYRDPVKRDMLTGNSINKVWQAATSLRGPLNPSKTMTDINNELSGYVGTSDHNSIPMEGQTKMYPKFDGYLKWRNPSLHNKKQIIDFDNGMIRVPDAVTSYKPLIGAVKFLDKTFYPSPENMIARK